MDDYLSKPIRSAELGQALRRASAVVPQRIAQQEISPGAGNGNGKTPVVLDPQASFLGK